MKKLLYLILCVMLVTSILAGCQGGSNDSSSASSGYDRNEGLDPNAASAFFDDFTDANFSASIWDVMNQKWGPDFNHGVRPENVLWNNSGIVTLKSYGQYYKDASKTCQGGVLITKDSYGPGRYEVKMKLLPRFGACTAFWTYMYGNSQDLEGNSHKDLNQEIDIELNVGNSFKQAWFTNWVTVDDSAHVEKELPSPLNDGEWHVYTFEWHTDPMRVDYYIDGVHYYTSYSYVPYVAGAINIGNWFPDGWAGTPDFEEDYVQLDYVSFTPYKGQPCIPSNAGGGGASFPTVSTPLPAVANLITDGSLENVYQSGKGPWAYYKTCETVSENGAKAMKVSAGGTVSQIISGAYDGFEYTLKASVKGVSGASIKIYYLKDSTEYIGAPTVYNLDSLSNEYGEIEFSFTAPEGCRRVEVALCGGNDHAIFDNVFMNLSKLMK